MNNEQSGLAVTIKKIVWIITVVILVIYFVSTFVVKPYDENGDKNNNVKCYELDSNTKLVKNSVDWNPSTGKVNVRLRPMYGFDEPKTYTFHKIVDGKEYTLIIKEKRDTSVQIPEPGGY